jgi:hypothetical protein
MSATFRGGEAETRDLLDAIRRNCDCQLVGDKPDGSCGAHQMMCDQRTLDSLLFVRRKRKAQLLEAEHSPQAEFGAPGRTGDGQ